jgi:hypothetical protein
MNRPGGALEAAARLDRVHAQHIGPERTEP